MILTETPTLMFSDFYSSDDYTLSKITEPRSAGEIIKEFIADGPGRVLQSVEVTVSWYCSIMERLTFGSAKVSYLHQLTMRNSYCPHGMMNEVTLDWN